MVAFSITQFFTGREGLGTKVQALADIRTNSVIVYAAPRDMDEVRRLVESLDTADSDTVNQAKVIPVRNALAEDIAQTLQQAIALGRGSHRHAFSHPGTADDR